MDICTGIGGTAFTPTYPGIFTISASMKQGVKASQAESALADVIAEVQAHGVTPKKLK